jgi:hypothetical protein
MSKPILDVVLANLRARKVPWTVVARDSGVPYDTLKKIAAGTTSNPGVLHIQALFEYFDRPVRAGENPSNTPDASLQVATIVVVSAGTKDVARDVADNRNGTRPEGVLLRRAQAPSVLSGPVSHGESEDEVHPVTNDRIQCERGGAEAHSRSLERGVDE